MLGPQVQQKGGYPPRKGPRPTGSDRLGVLKYPFAAPDPSKEALYPLSTPLLGGTWASSCDSYTRFGAFGVLSGSCAHAFAWFVGHFARVMYASVRLIIDRDVAGVYVRAPMTRRAHPPTPANTMFVRCRARKVIQARYGVYTCANTRADTLNRHTHHPNTCAAEDDRRMHTQ